MNTQGKAMRDAELLLAGDGTMAFRKRGQRARVAAWLRSQGFDVDMGTAAAKDGRTLFVLSAPVVRAAKQAARDRATT